MYNHIKLVLLGLLLITSLPSLKAQNEESMFGYNNLSINMINMPSTLVDYRIIVGIPVLAGLDVGLSSKAVTIGDVIGDGGNLAQNLQKLRSNLEYTQYVIGSARQDLFYLGFRELDKMYYFGASMELFAQLDYPKELVDLLLDGNTIPEGQTEKVYNLSGIAVDTRLLGKLYFGYNHRFRTRSGDFTVGARLNIISSGLNFVYRGENLKLTTSSPATEVGHRLSFTGEITSYISGAKWKDGDRSPDFGSAFKDVYSTAFSFANVGTSLDLGLTYQKNHYTHYIGIKNLGGFISNSNDTYVRKEQFVNLKFEGVDIKKTNINAGLFTRWRDQLEGFTDSIAFPDKSSKGQVETVLPLRFRLASMYDFSSTGDGMHRVGGQANYSFLQDFGFWNVDGFYLFDMDYFFQTKVSVGWGSSGLRSGLSFMHAFGPFQMFMGASNVVDMIQLSNFNEGYINFGVSLVADRLFLFRNEEMPRVRIFSQIR